VTIKSVHMKVTCVSYCANLEKFRVKKIIVYDFGDNSKAPR